MGLTALLISVIHHASRHETLLQYFLKIMQTIEIVGPEGFARLAWPCECEYRKITEGPHYCIEQVSFYQQIIHDIDGFKVEL